MIWQDPIVAQVRQARQAHAAQFAFDPEAIYRSLKEQEKKSTRTKVSFPPRRIPAPGVAKDPATTPAPTVA